VVIASEGVGGDDVGGDGAEMMALARDAISICTVGASGVGGFRIDKFRVRGLAWESRALALMVPIGESGIEESSTRESSIGIFWHWTVWHWTIRHCRIDPWRDLAL